MKPKKLEYYDWHDDIEPELCKIIGIDVSDFRGYHKVVYPELRDDNSWENDEAPYYDFWHVWLSIYNEDGRVQNGAYVVHWFPCEDNEWDYQKKKVTGYYGEWAAVLVDAVKTMLDKHNLDDEVIIYYSW